MNVDHFFNAVDCFIGSLGDPDFDVRYPVIPVPRPSGKPLVMSAKQIERYSSGDEKQRRLAQRARVWARLKDFRDAVRFWTIEAKAPHFGGPVVAFMEFYRNRVRGQTDQVVVETKPDLKNLIWAMEDALNPRSHRVGGKMVAAWPGLWDDDAKVQTFAMRSFGDPGVRVRLWKLDK